jgi:hypothetical protein
LLLEQLRGPEAEAVEAHVESCAACQQVLESLTAATRTGPGVESSGAAGADFLRRLEEEPPTGAWPGPGPEEGATLPPRAPAADSAEAPPAPPAVAGYEVLEELGRGGMGVVYKARDHRLGRVVALKMVLAGQLAGDEERERFLREAVAIAHLQHPNIVAIHDSGEAPGGVPYFTLEYCSGGTLADKVAEPWPVREAAGLVETLARAVQFAHERGVVHRDLKPGNGWRFDWLVFDADYGKAPAFLALLDHAGQSQDLYVPQSYGTGLSSQGALTARGQFAELKMHTYELAEHGGDRAERAGGAMPGRADRQRRGVVPGSLGLGRGAERAAGGRELAVHDR